MLATTGPGIASTPVMAALMVATVAAELSLARPAPGPGHRVASLRPRDLAGYLPPVRRVAPAIAGSAAAAAWLATLALPPQPPPARELPSAATVALGVAVAVVTPVATALACRWIIRRPQPLVDPDVVAADDAARTDAVAYLAALAAVVVLFDLAGALVQFAEWADGAGDAVLAGSIVAVLALAGVAWLRRDIQWGVDRGAGGRRAGADAPDPSGPAVRL